MVIAHNVLAMNAQRQFGIVSTDSKKNTEKLSSGYKINRAADDAAGLTISEKIRYVVNCYLWKWNGKLLYTGECKKIYCCC